MSRSVSTGTAAEIVKTITQPHNLVKIAYDTPLYYCSSGDVTWDGQVWAGQDITLSNLNPDKGTGTLIIGDVSGVFGALVLQYGIADVPITIWRLYGAGPWATGDEELLFAGVGGGVDWRPKKSVKIDLQPAANRMMFSPRIVIAASLGLNHLPVEGQAITWEGETYILERSSN